MNPDQLNVSILTALGGLVTALVAATISILNYRRGAHKDALQTANDQIEVLGKQIVALRNDYEALWRTFQAERSNWQTEREKLNTRLSNVERQNEELREQVFCLERERNWLNHHLIKNGIKVPPMPEDWTGT